MQLRFATGLLGSALFLGLAIAAPACTSSDTSIPAADASTTPVDSGGQQATGDAGDQTPATGEPITAKANEWTWVPFDDSTCGDGSATGIGVNLGTSKDLLIFMEGGGACWDKLTCFDLKTASNMDGFGEGAFTTRAGQFTGSAFDRTAATNAFKDASLVYIPYCTGDVHAGDKEQMYAGAPHSTKHFGRRNMDAFLKRIVPTFKDAARVVLSGSSAGGFGAAINYWRAKKAFGSVRVDLVDDSGPPFPVTKISPYAQWSAAWDLPGAVPPACTTCAAEISDLLPYYLKTYPEARFALLSYDNDPTIELFFKQNATDFAATLKEVTESTFDPSENGRVFEVAGVKHTMLGDLTTKSGTTTLSDFLTEMQGDGTWTSVKPATQ